MSFVAYVGLGANEGDRLSGMRRAVGMLDEHPDVVVEGVSPVYETEPEPPHLEQPDHLNGAVRLSTRLSAGDLLELLLTIEADLGRVRRGRAESRPIDLDLLLFGDLVIEAPGLAVPHPRMDRRRFVLRPLLDLDPDLSDPRDGASLEDLLAALPESRCVLRRHLALR